MKGGFRSLTKLEGHVAVLNRPALADFLRTIPGKSNAVLAGDPGVRPAANAKVYMEVCSQAPQNSCELQCSQGV